MGHPVYRSGSKGDVDPLETDSPRKNTLFKLLSTLSIELKAKGIESLHYKWWYDFSDWQSFCKFATDVYDQKR